MVESRSDPVEIGASPRKVTGRAVLGAFMTAVRAAIALEALDGSQPTAVTIAGWIGFAFFGAATLVLLWMLFNVNRPLVTIAPAGLKDSRVAAKTIPWRAIEDISTFEYNWEKKFVLGLRPGTMERLRPRSRKTWLPPPPHPLGWDRVDIDASLLRLPLSELLELCKERWIAARSEFFTGEETVRFYKQLGFFDGQAPQLVVERFIESLGRSPRLENSWDDAFLLSVDKSRVWADDPEADVCAEARVYSRVLAEWGVLSQGAFTPSDIVEFWKSEKGPVIVHFHLDGRPESIEPQYLDDWIDLDVLLQVNKLISTSGRQFNYVCDGNFALVLCLNTEQANAMRDVRQFPFAL